MNKLIALLFALLVFKQVNAQHLSTNSDTLKYYIDHSGYTTNIKDSMVYVRLILPPDSLQDKDLYRVYDYYLPNGKLVMAGTSLTKSVNSVFDGRCFFYFHNGAIQAKIDFSKGTPLGYITQYYPNGQIYTTIKVDISNPYYNSYNLHYGFSGIPTLFSHNGLDLQVLECRDSTGQITAAKGNGFFTQYSDDFKRIIQQGKLVNNKPESDWTGPIADSGKFIITYHKGEIKYGVSYMNSGRQYKFKQTFTRPEYSDGTPEFFHYLKKNTVYPESAKKRKIEGTVDVKFYVELNGTLSDVQVVNTGLTESLNQEALRVVKMSPLWLPGTIYGVPTRMSVTVGVDFYDN